jgi:hypothetical protein
MKAPVERNPMRLKMHMQDIVPGADGCFGWELKLQEEV